MLFASSCLFVPLYANKRKWEKEINARFLGISHNVFRFLWWVWLRHLCSWASFEGRHEDSTLASQAFPLSPVTERRTTEMPFAIQEVLGSESERECVFGRWAIVRCNRKRNWTGREWGSQQNLLAVSVRLFNSHDGSESGNSVRAS